MIAIDVEVSQVDLFGQFKIDFIPQLILPENCVDWSSKNEGANKIKIDLIISEATASMLDER